MKEKEFELISRRSVIGASMSTIAAAAIPISASANVPESPAAEPIIRDSHGAGIVDSPRQIAANDVPRQLTVRAHKDAWVVSVSATHGSMVKATDSLVELSSDEEERAKDRIRTAIALLEKQKMRIDQEVTRIDQEKKEEEAESEKAKNVVLGKGAASGDEVNR